MTEALRTATVEGETPVNPYSLLEAVNTSSDSANTTWLIFIAVMAYLLIAVAGVTHKDLLLASDIPLPVLQVKIELSRFFLFAPIALAVVHLGVVTQLALLARKALEFDSAIRMLEVSDRRTHPLRLELHNFFFVQAIAGPERSRVMSACLHGMAWMTLVILPVLLLLYIQVVFLPFHDVDITWAHRIVLLCDIAVLMFIGVFLTRSENSFFTALWRTTTAHPISFAVTFAVFSVVVFFSLFVATIPGEAMDRWSAGMPGAVKADAASGIGSPAPSVVMPVLGQRTDGSLFGVFQRNLNVTDQDLVVDKAVSPGETTLNLRGRDLRFARLDRTDLHQADLTGANLEGASLIGADLRGVLFQCADINALILSDDRVKARCPGAERANFTRARLNEARLSGLDLTSARLEEADLEGADLSYALLIGASFYHARLERTDLTGGVHAYGANFATASLQGADLTGAKLHGADFTSAGLQGAALAHAELVGATLRDVDLEGADARRANLKGADLTGAKLKAAALSDALIWMTKPPDRTSLLLTDMSGLAAAPLTESELRRLDRELQKLADQTLGAQIIASIQPMMTTDALANWPASAPDRQVWTAMAATGVAAASTAPAIAINVASVSGGPAPPVPPAPDAFAQRLTDYLARLACKPRWESGSIATGIAKRALGNEFKGDVARLYVRLTADGCPGGKAISRQVRANLLNLLDRAQTE